MYSEIPVSKLLFRAHRAVSVSPSSSPSSSPFSPLFSHDTQRHTAVSRTPSDTPAARTQTLTPKERYCRALGSCRPVDLSRSWNCTYVGGALVALQVVPVGNALIPSSYPPLPRGGTGRSGSTDVGRGLLALARGSSTSRDCPLVSWRVDRSAKALFVSFLRYDAHFFFFFSLRIDSPGYPPGG